MRPTDEAEFVRIVTAMAVLRGRELTDEALDLWLAAMSDWTIEDFKAAASHLVKSCQFMPTPYDFEQLRRAGEMTAGEAWELVLSGKPLEGRALRAARAVGGQYAIRHAHIERDLPHFERRFKEAYAELTDVDQVREALPQIARIDPHLTDALPGPTNGWARLS